MSARSTTTQIHVFAITVYSQKRKNSQNRFPLFGLTRYPVFFFNQKGVSWHCFFKRDDLKTIFRTGDCILKLTTSLLPGSVTSQRIIWEHDAVHVREGRHQQPLLYHLPPLHLLLQKKQSVKEFSSSIKSRFCRETGFKANPNSYRVEGYLSETVKKLNEK